MLVKMFCVKLSSSHRIPLSATNIFDYYSPTSNIRNYCISIIQDNIRPNALNRHNYAINNCNFFPIQYISRNNVNNRAINTSSGDKYITNKKPINTAAANTTTNEDTMIKVNISETRGQKLKRAVAEYGSTVIVFHIVISLIWLGTCYLLVTSGLDVNKVYTFLGLEEWLAKSNIASSAGTFAVAYAIYKVFAPARIAITLTSVPFIVRHLRKIGFLKK